MAEFARWELTGARARKRFELRAQCSVVARVFVLDYAVEGCFTPRLCCSSVEEWEHLEEDAFWDLLSGQDDLGLPLLEVVASGGIAVGGELVFATNLEYERPIVGVAGASGAQEQSTAEPEPDYQSPHTRTIPNEVALVFFRTPGTDYPARKKWAARCMACTALTRQLWTPAR